MSDLVKKARDLAYMAHGGQVDKAGASYFEHLCRVAEAVRGDDEAEVVAWLHDLLEDRPELEGETNFLPDHLFDSIVTLTRCKEISTRDYYIHIRRDPIALRVKLADIADNADESRLALLDEKTADRLRRKYKKALEALT